MSLGIAIVFVILGFILLVWGADRFIAGASATARNLGVSPLIIGLTVVGFGTSAPEMVVSGVAALRGSPGLAVGNAVGSNMANLCLILGVAGLIYPLQVHSSTLKREFPILLLVTLGTLFFIVDGDITFVDGVILLVGLVSLTTWMTMLGMRRTEPDPMAAEFAAEIPSDMTMRAAVSWLVIGMIVLPASSHMLVVGATAIAQHMGVSDLVIGLTVVAIGTSLPELAAAIASVLKREHELVIGNVIGSNMFNLLGVLGIASILTPVTVEPIVIWRDYSTMLVATLLVFTISYGFRGPGRISRRSGALLLTIYLAYMAAVFYTEYFVRTGS